MGRITQNGGGFCCSQCTKVYKRAKNLRQHVMSTHEQKLFLCNHCNKSFGRKDTLSLHMQIHLHESMFECDSCKKTFYHTKTYKNHLLSHQQKIYKCQRCPKEYTSKLSLEKHNKKCS